MPRGKVSKPVINEEKLVVQPSNANVSTEVKNINEIDDLKKQIAELTKMIVTMAQQKEEVAKVEKQELPTYQSNILDDPDDEDIKLSSDAYIKVMSLVPWTLNLCTEAKGRGKIFTFKGLYQVKRILYGDLVHIIERHSSFLEDGLFIIMDKRVVRRHGLDDTYERILTKEKIENILNNDNHTDVVNIFKAAPEKQQKAIVMVIKDKLLNGLYFDLNLLDRLSRVVGYNIQEQVEETKKVLSAPLE